jgi:aquaporin Z
MENSRLPANFDAPEARSNYFCTSFTVFIYEFIGTFTLVGVINATKGNAPAIGLTLFFLLLLCGPITGAHLNPAVTLGVWLNKVRSEANPGSITFQMVNMMAAQVCGALLGMFVFLQVLDRLNGEKVINRDDFPHLKPTTQGAGQAEFVEMFCTFIFVAANLLVKDSVAGKYSARIGTEPVAFLGCAIIACTLSGMIMFAGPHTGASINPAVSIAQTVMAKTFLQESVSARYFWVVYMMGPFVGAMFAGVASWLHATALRDHGPLECAAKESVQKNEDDPEKKPMIEKMAEALKQD